MTDFIEKQVQFISKLTRLSVEGKIEWEAHERGGFVGHVLGRDVRVFELERPAGTRSLRGRSHRMPVLEILTEGGQVGYAIEDRSGLDSLLASAAFRVARVDEFMAKVLAS